MKRMRLIVLWKMCWFVFFFYGLGIAQSAPLSSSPSGGGSAPMTGSAHGQEDMRSYCTNITPRFLDMHMAFEMQKLKEMESRIRQTMAMLEAKKKETQEYMDRFVALRTRASDEVVAIFAKMPAQSASSQLIRMDEANAASIISKLKPRAASSILAEMDADKAARLNSLMLSGVNGKKP